MAEGLSDGTFQSFLSLTENYVTDISPLQQVIDVPVRSFVFLAVAFHSGCEAAHC